MSARHEVRAELLAPAELDAALSEAPIVFVPLGSLEFHGPHLPIGLDALNAHGVCIGAARRVGGIVLPALYYGVGGGHSAYPWTIMLPDARGVVAELTTTLYRLAELGAKTGVLFTGHFADEQLAMIDELAASWNSAHEQALRVIATGVNRCPASLYPPDHAGIFETLLLNAIAPELVHLDCLPSLREHPTVDPDGDQTGRQRHDPTNPLWGIFGPDPREAVLADSQLLYDRLVEWLSALAETP